MDEQPFLDAIFADWRNDTARLVYADWLDERGDPRGEFIRLQIERARYPAYDDRARKLRKRERWLLHEHGHFLPPMWRQVGLCAKQGDEPNRLLLRFDRGILTTIRMAFETFIRCNGQLAAAWPVRCGLQLRQEGHRYHQLARCGALRNVTDLHIDPRCFVSWLAHLVEFCECPHFRQLRTLDLPDIRAWGLSRNSFNLDAARALLNNPGLEHLQRLRIAAPVTDAAEKHLRRRFGRSSHADRYTVFG